LLAIVCGWGVGLMGCGSRGGPGVLGFAMVVLLIFGGWPKTFVRRTSAVCTRARPPGKGRLLRRLIAELLCASRDTRAASPAARGGVDRGLA
jgi:hypothetical protein